MHRILQSKYSTPPTSEHTWSFVTRRSGIEEVPLRKNLYWKVDLGGHTMKAQDCSFSQPSEDRTYSKPYKILTRSTGGFAAKIRNIDTPLLRSLVSSTTCIFNRVEGDNEPFVFCCQQNDQNSITLLVRMSLTLCHSSEKHRAYQLVKKIPFHQVPCAIT